MPLGDAVVYTPPPARRAAPAGAVPSTAVERTRMLIDVLDRLAGLLDGDAAPQRGAPTSRRDTDRQTLVRGFDELGRLLRVDRDGIAAMAPELRDELVTGLTTVRSLAEGNLRALSARVRAQKIIVDTLVRSVGEQRRAEGFYRDAGTPRRAGGLVGTSRVPASTLNTLL